ncbi:MAG TPA: hypothetical protein VHT92_12560 [Candidatus Cybelea sp.]|jgi:predicted acylesterase/phospholipase RssA|nr:hypothetical protein [Candidatus Cybelea sp.]
MSVRETFSIGDFQNERIRRLCDVVMKGGVTSGIVYPLAICKLATSYVIKSIGGTSVGAIAAAVTAAAEYRRRNGSGQGYVELAKLPGFLGGKGVLLALFAADPVARPLLNVALTLIGNGSILLKAIRLAGALTAHYFWIPLLCVAVVFGSIVAAAAPSSPEGVEHCLLVSLIFGLIASTVVVTLWFVYQVIATLNRNNFGWCHGYSRDADERMTSVTDAAAIPVADVPPLFNWLDAFIAQTAGTREDQVLTFGDLWGSKNPPWHTPTEHDRGIDFRMVTTCLTLGRPFSLPFDPHARISPCDDCDTDFDEDGHRRPPFYFREKDLDQYFSAKVVCHMVRFGARTKLSNGAAYYRFPAARRVPIIVATRLSMSFPVLFCALPLYALDANGRMQRMWFSDGGLTSNFPIHFFDSPLPRWPTFAVDLLGGAPGSEMDRPDKSHRRPSGKARYTPGDVFIESEARRGTVNPWDKLDRGDARGNVLAFASSILDAARGWQDVTLGGLPGNASRIVGVRLADDQGGLNLNMQPETISEMSGLGLKAGTELVERFATGAVDPEGWKKHRWIRYRATMGAITRWAQGFTTGYSFHEQPGQEPYDELITQLPEHQRNLAADATSHLAMVSRDQFGSKDVAETFFSIEEKPIAVLPTRPVF